ncbi:hypothetical protein AMS68_005925 [Peltaster fructicola]|uniref:Zn(2)-C6 fungal-type domain-containing protein n=1 Tax=Peltaster fructicola TaxID=286661 RepID=A0A6H0Y0N8_9PEZI|nr:hypothetical protein AMS68_005925 [Peltaster fructicola]
MAPKRKRLIACNSCHKKKIRCSATGPPCINCTSSASECVYPVKDRKIKIGEHYLKSVLDENRRLASGISTPNSVVATPSATTPAQGVQDQACSLPSASSISTPRADNADRNPVIGEQPWFVSLKTSDLPIHIGEAADAAFATRLRQTVLGQPVSHMPRVHYMDDDTLRTLQEQSPQWPSASRLRFLVDVALKTICTRWHVVRRSVVLAKVERFIQQPGSCDWNTRCKLWALLAIGEVFSSRCAMPATTFPGALYWAKAMSLMSIAPERPHLEVVEIYLLLAFYASCLNRRHTSITLASQALRICVILGLHLEIDQSQLKDVALREHRCRLWWSAYRYDRLWASKIGWPPSIPDDSIEIGLPSNIRLPADLEGDFEDADYTVAALRLAGMSNSAINTLYVRKRHTISFTERVQAAVRTLREWSESLPPRLRLSDNAVPQYIPNHLLYLHLAFNQGVIVISRPILLHLLKQRRLVDNTVTDVSHPALSESATSLAMACVRRARQSANLLSRAWADGTFQTFDYFFTQFLFSSATILGLSALLRGPNWNDDRQEFLLALSFLHQLERNGNFGAREFSTHADAIEELLRDDLDARPDGIVLHEQQHTVLAEPLQDFLNDPDLNLEGIDFGLDQLDWQDMFLSDIPQV